MRRRRTGFRVPGRLSSGLEVDMAKRSPATRKPPEKDFKALSLRLSPEAWRQLKHLAIDQESSAHSLLLDGVNEVFKKHGKKPIA